MGRCVWSIFGYCQIFWGIFGYCQNILGHLWLLSKYSRASLVSVKYSGTSLVTVKIFWSIFGYFQNTLEHLWLLLKYSGAFLDTFRWEGGRGKREARGKRDEGGLIKRYLWYAMYIINQLEHARECLYERDSIRGGVIQHSQSGLCLMLYLSYSTPTVLYGTGRTAHGLFKL